jgi:hypothetical protein
MSTKPQSEPKVNSKRVRAYMSGWRHGASNQEPDPKTGDSDYEQGYADGQNYQQVALSDFRNRILGEILFAPVTPKQT